MTLERLKSLPLESLQQIAIKEGIKIPENIGKEDLIDIIIEALEENQLDRNNQNNNPVSIIEKKYDITNELELDARIPLNGSLPEGYNETKIEVLLRDPEWAYTYWDIKESELKAISKNPSYRTLYLRVNEYEGVYCGQNNNDKVIEYFDIPVRLTDNQWYINLPHQGVRYNLELRCYLDGKDKLLAKSNTVTVPKGNTVGTADYSDLGEEVILTLAGINNLENASFNNKIPHRIISLVDDQYVR